MSASVVSSPIRSAGTGLGSPDFRSQRKMSAGTIMKKIQTLQDTIESLRQQLTFTRAEEEEGGVQKKTKELVKEPKEKKTTVTSAEGATKQKKMQKTKEEEEKDKIPMPWTGQADFTTCVGLKAQYGLFIQCGKACDSKSTSFQIDNHECRFCADCSKKCDENGKHSVGTIEERIEAGVGKYVNAKTGKKETIYIEVLEKMGITKEQALESAQKRGFQIPDWMLEKAEKKRGRPPAAVVASIKPNDTDDEFKTKEKKPRQPRTKKTTVSVKTHDTPQKKDSAQGSVCIDLNDINKSDGDVTPVSSVETAPAAPQEKKKRGRPAKSNTQNNVGESEMQKLIVQATTEKKKRLSIDPSETISPLSSQEEAVETCLQFDSDEGEKNQHTIQEDDDALFDMFNEIIEHQEQHQKQEQPVASAAAPTVVDDVIENKEKVKKSKKNASEEKVEKVKTDKKKDKDSKAASAEAAKKKAKEEEEAAAAAALKKAQEEEAKKKNQVEDDETEDEEDGSNDEEEEELECEEYEYDGEIYGLAPNGDIYSQDGELVGRLKNGVPKMF